jgi:hypothetical protein
MLAGLLIIFICSWLLAYWVARVVLLLRGDGEAIESVLDCDLWRGRRLLPG